jgi:hypothetical protein
MTGCNWRAFPTAGLAWGNAQVALLMRVRIPSRPPFFQAALVQMEKQPENHKPRKPAMTDTNQLPVLIEEAYRLFAPCRAGFPLAICTCECCSPADFQRELLRFPLRDIPEDYLQAYLGSVPLDDEAATARDMKHFLPRILEAIVRGEDIRSLEEMQLDKLRCDLPEVWSAAELDFLRRFARAWFVRQLTAAPDYGNPAAALVMFHHAGLDITAELLDIWTQHADRLPALPAFVETWTALPVDSKEWRQDFYLPADRRYDPAVFNQAFAQWFENPATRTAFHAALETALLAGSVPADEVPLWECCYDDLGRKAA